MCLHLSHTNFSDIASPGEKDQLAQALKNEEDARKSYAGELGETRGEVTQLRTELEKLREELGDQVTAATQAKDGFDVTERRLRANIGALRQENEKLKAARVEEYKKKKEGKVKPAAKSIVTLDVKPWGMFCPDVNFTHDLRY